MQHNENQEHTSPTIRIYMTMEEKRLLEQFRALAPEERRKVLAVLRRLAESQK